MNETLKNSRCPRARRFAQRTFAWCAANRTLCEQAKGGGINPKVHPVFKETGPVTGVLDGDDGFGHVICDMAMDRAIDMAKKNGVGMVTAVNSSHCGALSYFVQKQLKKS